MNEKIEELELVELGDAKEETKGALPSGDYDWPNKPEFGFKVI